MKITYDAEVDALAIIFQESEVITKELAEGITAEYDRNSRLVGLEIFDAVHRFGNTDTFRKVTLEGIDPATA